MKTITISNRSYNTLKRWASVSRTLNESLRLLEDYSETIGDCEENRYAVEEVLYNMDELEDILRPLDECGQACKG